MPKLRTESFVGAGDFRWLRSDHAIWNGRTESLDVGAFTAGTHYPNGYIPSGTMVSRLASGLWGPFDNAAASSEHGILFGSVTPPNLADLTQDVAGALVRNNANVDFNKLPTGGRPTLAIARTALPRVQFDDVTP